MKKFWTGIIWFQEITLGFGNKLTVLIFDDKST
jgi:hypothetical protein